MPELPEVETIKNGVLKIIDDQIIDIVVRNRNLRYKIPENLNLNCANKIVKNVYRRGKYLIIQLDKGSIVIHFGMTGNITFVNKNLVDIKKHDHIDLVLSKYVLRYNDPRRFGFIAYVENLAEYNLLNKLGVEPLSTDFNADYLFSIIKTRNTMIKQLIMNNEIVVGVGNIYASESLFLCGISPIRAGKNISKKSTIELVSCIKNVLIKAIEQGGSTLKDYKRVDGSSGYFQISHNVYGKSGKPCIKCGFLISEIKIAQRNSFYCNVCQK